MKICELRVEKDWSFNQIGREFAISPQRTQEILKRDLDKYLKGRKSN